MRIVAGQFRGRPIRAPKGDTTRPTSDRVREALFSSLVALHPEIFSGKTVLDAFAGSGALGIEALSRGCASATFIECDRGALACLRRNLDDLGIAGASRVIAGDSQQLARRGSVPGGPFALLLLDPPYRLEASTNIDLVASLGARDLLEPEALIVLEHARGVVPPWSADTKLVTRKRYGATEIDIAVYERGAGLT